MTLAEAQKQMYSWQEFYDGSVRSFGATNLGSDIDEDDD